MSSTITQKRGSDEPVTALDLIKSSIANPWTFPALADPPTRGQSSVEIAKVAAIAPADAPLSGALQTTAQQLIDPRAIRPNMADRVKPVGVSPNDPVETSKGKSPVKVPTRDDQWPTLELQDLDSIFFPRRGK